MTGKTADTASVDLAELRTALQTVRKAVLPNATQLDNVIAASDAPDKAIVALVGSKPFRKRFGKLFTGIGFGYPGNDVEHDAAPEVLQKLFDHTAQTWGKLGEEDAAWSVLSDERFRKSDAGVPESFWASGVPATKHLMAALARNGIKPPFNKVVEYGCGIGRVSIPLSEHCGTLHAYDISGGHLAMAKDRAAQCGVDNIVFTQMTKPDQEIITGYDLYYSYIVFQHNPPPIMARLVRQALEGLAPGGVAVFQLPTFRRGYGFELDAYMEKKSDGIEMHVLPQRVVFDIVDDCDCRMIDMFEVSANLRDRLLSNFFTVQKRGG